MAGDTEELWPVSDIVYTSIVGLVMLAALLEWFLWIAAFLYCLWKVFVKAEHWTVRVLAIFVGLAFTLLRLIFLPIMVVTLPLPSVIARVWPEFMVQFLQWFAFWSFAGLLTIPWLFCIYQIVTHHLGRTKRIKQVLDEVSAPKVVIVMPCYKEEPEVLVTAINSVVDCDYPPSCIHVFLSFDGDQEDELYLNTIEKVGVPLTLESYPKSIDVAYRGARITVSRFPHGGKRHCQKMTFKLIDKVYKNYLRRNDNLFILFIDSDCILDRVCLQNFVYDMELSPGNRRDMLAMTGVITSTTQKHSLITLLQDMEYVHGQLFERTVESGCGAVTCLPGALTMLRFSAFRRMAKYYFADKAEQCEDLFDFAKGHLGEDRWLTHLFMIGAKKRYQIQMCTSAFCKTEAVQTMRSLIKQRRRWFLGFITNEVCMLTDWRLWKRYPILVLVRFMQNTIRTTALLFFIMVMALMTTSKGINDLPVGFIAISLGLNWLLMIYFGTKLRRFKIWLYPMMFILNPFFNWYYMVYGIFTAGQRTWGGPRADAAVADSSTTAQEAIEKAEEAGDVLNIVPESFIPAAQERAELELATAEDDDDEDDDAIQEKTRKKRKRRKPVRTDTADSTGHDTFNFSFNAGAGAGPSVPLFPPDQIDGRFAAPERTASGWYHHPDAGSSVFTLPSPYTDLDDVDMDGRNNLRSPVTDANTQFNRRTSTPLHHQFQGVQVQRDSFDSSYHTSAHDNINGSNVSVYMPHRVESIMGEEDRRKYELAQAGHISSLAMRESRTWRGVQGTQRPPFHGQGGYVVEVGDEGVGGGSVSGGGSTAAASPVGTPAFGATGSSSDPAPAAAAAASESRSRSRSRSRPRPGAGSGSGIETTEHQRPQQQPRQGHPGSTSAVDLLAGSSTGGRPSLVPPPPAVTTMMGVAGRSPLGRASWTRPVTRDEVEAEIDESHGSQAHTQGQGQRSGIERSSPRKGL